MKIQPTTSSGYIRGHTVVDHKRRCKLNLTLSEYVFLDAIEQLIVRNGKFHARTMQDDLYKICGILPDAFKVLGGKLREKEMLLHQGGNIFTLGQKWSEGSADIKQEFEALWLLLGRVGNKKKGLQMYDKARKAGFEADFLKKRVDVYVKFVKDSEQYPLHVSSFFNPANEEFNNEFKVINKKKKGGFNETNEVFEGKF